MPSGHALRRLDDPLQFGEEHGCRERAAIVRLECAS